MGSHGTGECYAYTIVRFLQFSCKLFKSDSVLGLNGPHVLRRV